MLVCFLFISCYRFRFSFETTRFNISFFKFKIKYSPLTVTINASKESVRFSANGEIGAGNITLRQSSTTDSKERETKFDVQEPVALAFALRYLNFFTKASPLSPDVRLSMSKDGMSLTTFIYILHCVFVIYLLTLLIVPLLVEYAMDEELGHVRYYLAPRIEDEDN